MMKVRLSNFNGEVKQKVIFEQILKSMVKLSKLGTCHAIL